MAQESIDTPLPLAEDSSREDVSTGDILLVNKLAEAKLLLSRYKKQVKRLSKNVSELQVLTTEELSAKDFTSTLSTSQSLQMT